MMPSKSIEQMGWKSVAKNGEFGKYENGMDYFEFDTIRLNWFWWFDGMLQNHNFKTLRAAIAATKAKP